jgi:hypothetical protein
LHRTQPRVVGECTRERRDDTAFDDHVVVEDQHGVRAQLERAARCDRLSTTTR